MKRERIDSQLRGPGKVGLPISLRRGAKGLWRNDHRRVLWELQMGSEPSQGQEYVQRTLQQSRLSWKESKCRNWGGEGDNEKGVSKSNLEEIPSWQNGIEGKRTKEKKGASDGKKST